MSLLRWNSLFFGSHKGGETASMYLSLVVSCRLNGINVMDYITDILNRCASWNPTTPVDRYRNLLPDRCKPADIIYTLQRLLNREPLILYCQCAIAETDTYGKQSLRKLAFKVGGCAKKLLRYSSFYDGLSG